eukprot:scaffold131883_cov39-Prasinocladus_malaysianus.AAC.2
MCTNHTNSHVYQFPEFYPKRHWTAGWNCECLTSAMVSISSGAILLHPKQECYQTCDGKMWPRPHVPRLNLVNRTSTVFISSAHRRGGYGYPTAAELCDFL